MSKNKIDLSWHIVCGSVEVEELTKYKHLRPWKPKNHRQGVFMVMKYPDTTFYLGGWGPELLHFVDDGPYRGPVGKIYCTYSRYIEIARWFLLSMYRP